MSWIVKPSQPSIHQGDYNIFTIKQLQYLTNSLVFVLRNDRIIWLGNSKSYYQVCVVFLSCQQLWFMNRNHDQCFALVFLAPVFAVHADTVNCLWWWQQHIILWSRAIWMQTYGSLFAGFLHIKTYTHSPFLKCEFVYFVSTVNCR